MRKKRILYLIFVTVFSFLGYYYFNLINKAHTKLKGLLMNGDSFSLTISLIALLVSIIALIYTIRTFWLKSGEKLRFTYSPRSSVLTDDRYISFITLENLKDRPIVIFEIYFKIGNNNYILLEEFEEEPLIIKPFEVYNKKYDPILFYSSNLTRVKIDHLLSDSDLKKSLVVSTTNGKHEVQSWVDRWSIHSDLFSNHLTTLARPRRLVYKGQAYGKNVKYLVDLTYKNGNEQVLDLTEDSYRYVSYKKLNLSKECLESKDKLEKHIKAQKGKDFKISSVKVIDWQSSLDRYEELEKEEVFKPENYNKLFYHIIGRIITAYKSYQLKKENKQKNK